jgi:hypothetical protein
MKPRTKDKPQKGVRTAMKTRHTPLSRVALLLLLPTVFACGVPWAPTGGLLTARAYHTATLLPGGEVLAAGGLGITNLFSTVVLASAELYNPVAGTWSATGSMTTNCRSDTIVCAGPDRSSHFLSNLS